MKTGLGGWKEREGTGVVSSIFFDCQKLQVTVLVVQTFDIRLVRNERCGVDAEDADESTDEELRSSSSSSK